MDIAAIAGGRKTSAAPRLVPILPDLIKMGLLDWAKKQAASGTPLFSPALSQEPPRMVEMVEPVFECHGQQ
ncbi:MAG: hypothetical protein ACLPJJ_00290 [Acidocella sp.]|uniref:hypothetical protein n=1 Tax=Acidocella sp. TaxID=50710 RepID=UPI003FD72A29